MHCWVPLQGANLCFISSYNEFCLELLADVALFSTLITQKLFFCYLGSMLVKFLLGIFEVNLGFMESTQDGSTCSSLLSSWHFWIPGNCTKNQGTLSYKGNTSTLFDYSKSESESKQGISIFFVKIYVSF